MPVVTKGKAAVRKQEIGFDTVAEARTEGDTGTSANRSKMPVVAADETGSRHRGGDWASEKKIIHKMK